jgi:hypothetical protein
MTTARGVLKRHCAIGKTPLLAARLCNRRLACQSAALPEYPLARPQPSFVLCASARGAITDALGSLSYALNAGGGDAGIGCDGDGVSGAAGANAKVRLTFPAPFQDRLFAEPTPSAMMTR